MDQALNVVKKLINSHLLQGMMNADEEIGIKIDQILTNM